MKNFTLPTLAILTQTLAFGQLSYGPISNDKSPANASTSAKITLPYSQDFEGGTFPPADWEFFGSDNNANWEHSATVGAYEESNGSALFDNFNNTFTGKYYGIRAATLDLTNATSPKLRFDVAYSGRTGSSSDRLGVWYSLDGTSGWMNITNFENAALYTTAQQASYFTPTATQWDSIEIDLKQFAGESLIRFAFENNCSSGNVIYIDNVVFYDADKLTGVTESISKSDVYIYPNPSNNNVFNINTGNLTVKSFEIFNQLGQQVNDYRLNETSDNIYRLEMEQTAKGIYYLRLVVGEKVLSRKLVLE